MRLLVEGLLCACIAAGCSTDKPAENAESTSVAENDATVSAETRESSDLTPDSPDPIAPVDTVDDEAARRRALPTTAPATIGGEPSSATRTPDKAPSDTRDAPDKTQPDNTKTNKRDANTAAMTPIDQGNNAADLELTQQIRQAVMADKSLSFTAKNVKIITLNRKVTLRGPVKSAAERASIDAAARKIAGAGMVDNQLEVAP